MADSVVSAVVKTALGMLSSPALKEIDLHWGFKDDLDKLESTFGTIQLVLEDAEIKQGKNAALQNWLRKLRDATYDAENIFDDIANLERGTQSQFKCRCLSFIITFLSRMKMARQVRDIREKLDAIAKDRQQFHLEERVVQNHDELTSERRHTTSLLNEEEKNIYGRSEEKEVIMKKIVDGTCDQDDDLSVYAVEGMGGLGKTTLAQMVFNDERTMRHFDLRIWVCISDDFCIRRIVRETLDSIEGGDCSNSSLDAMERLLQEKLRGRRFLLVLDDVWNEKPRLWFELKKVLRCGSKGSVLVVTTRSERIASMMAPIANVHHLTYLSDVDSWELFRQTVFTDGLGEENFTAIGKVMVKKCDGVPLAIKALGSLMRFKSDEREWLAVKESEMWDDENGILPALRLSYDSLVPQLRQCFAYCCMFPKDYLMEESQLIQLWMANGYIPYDSQTDLLVTGRLIIKELVWRSFLQDAERDYRDNVRYKMHDLMHDLAFSVMGHESRILEKKVLTIPKTVRHLSFDSSYSWDLRPIDNSLRSIIVHGYRTRKGFPFLLSKQRYLRALDVSSCYIEKLPDLVCKLEHLRYLAMSCSEIKRLPESLTHLYNLQTLKLMESWNLVELPRGMKVMKNLWFLDIEYFNSLLSTPPELGALTCLHRLSIFIVGEDASHQIDQLKDLDLEGELTIKGLDNVENIEAARSANLMRKKNLSSLSLSWTNGIEKKSTEDCEEEVLQGLQPHQNLEKITIESFHGSRFPNWMSASIFGKLEEISLRGCPRCEHIPPLGKLPSLKRLWLNGLDSIKCWDVECYGNGESSYPALTSLNIWEMPNFEEWTIPDSVESFPSLKDLSIGSCPKLTGLPMLPNLEDLRVSDVCEALLRPITSITSLKSLRLSHITTLDVVPEGLLQNHKALQYLDVDLLPIRTLSDMLDNLSALKTLYVWNCSNLKFIPEGLKYLRCLERLNISGCDGLISFPATLLEDLSSLRLLCFRDCKKLKPLSGSLRQAPPLHELHINGLPELEYLPESMHLLTSLSKLQIWNCKGLCSLPNWLGSLESLSEIEILHCGKLMYLPDGFTNLKSLRMLTIRGCPELEKRCEKPNGEDWPKISHIPFVSINYVAIQDLGDEE